MEELVAAVDPAAEVARAHARHEGLAPLAAKAAHKAVLLRDARPWPVAEEVAAVEGVRILLDALDAPLEAAGVEVGEKKDFDAPLAQAGADGAPFVRRPVEPRVCRENRPAVNLRVVGVPGAEPEDFGDLVDLVGDRGLAVEAEADEEVGALGRPEEAADVAEGGRALADADVHEEAVDAHADRLPHLGGVGIGRDVGGGMVHVPGRGERIVVGGVPGNVVRPDHAAGGDVWRGGKRGRFARAPGNCARIVGVRGAGDCRRKSGGRDELFSLHCLERLLT